MIMANTPWSFGRVTPKIEMKAMEQVDDFNMVNLSSIELHVPCTHSGAAND
jgi:hypothetical protein